MKKLRVDTITQPEAKGTFPVEHPLLPFHPIPTVPPFPPERLSYRRRKEKHLEQPARRHYFLNTVAVMSQFLFCK